eukprot:105589_1
MASEFYSLREQRALIGGFCRREYAYSIPLMLIKLMLNFYNEIMYWKINEDQLKCTLSMPKGQCVFSKPISAKHISFHFFLYPKGKHSTKGNAKFGICIKNMSQDIDYVVVNGKWYNKEFDMYTVFAAKYTKDSDLGSSLFNLASCNHIKELNFCGTIDILCVRPKHVESNKQLMFIKPAIKLHSTSHLVWHMDDSLLDKLKADCTDHRSRKVYHSGYHGMCDNLIFRLVRRVNSTQSYHLCVSLLQFSMRIQEMDIVYSLNVFRNGEPFEDERNAAQARVTHDTIHEVMDVVFYVDDELMPNTTSMTAVFGITIKDIYDWDGNVIPQTDWADYGLVDNEY